MNSPTTRLKYLDSIRGIAAMAVVISHMGYYTDNLSFIPNWVWSTPAVIFTMGWQSVSVFFVLSGFVLSHRIFNAKGSDFVLSKDLVPFLANRTARICIPFVAVLGLSFLGYAVTKNYHFSEFVTVPDQLPWMRSRWGYELGILDVVRQTFLPVPGGGNRLIPQDWSLTVEYNVSLLFPFFIVVATQSLGALWLLVILLLKKHWYFIHFAFGISISKSFEKIAFVIPSKFPYFGALTLSVGLIIYWNPFGVVFPEVEGYDLRWIWNGVGAALMICGVVASSTVQRVLSIRPLLYLGKISYSIYLVHILVLKVMTPPFLRYINNQGITGVVSTSAVFTLFTISIVIALSDILYRFVEIPSMQVGRWLSSKIYNALKLGKKF